MYYVAVRFDINITPSQFVKSVLFETPSAVVQISIRYIRVDIIFQYFIYPSIHTQQQYGRLQSVFGRRRRVRSCCSSKHNILLL